MKTKISKNPNEIVLSVQGRHPKNPVIMKNNKFNILPILVAGAFIFNIALVISIIWIAYHFISKWW